MRRRIAVLLILAVPFVFFGSAYAQRHNHVRYPFHYGYVGNDRIYPSPLVDRSQILSVPPENTFAFEVKKLGPAPSGVFTPAENKYWSELDRKYISEDDKIMEKYEQDNLTAAQFIELKTARAATSAFESYGAGKTLPASLRNYTVGAVAFHNENYADALPRFTDSLTTGDFPASKVWASFMQGRTYAKLKQYDQARAAFAATRDLVVKGAPDMLGLAAASYGEEARLVLDTAGGILRDHDYDNDKPNRNTLFVEAIKLYAQQAHTGSASGINSLHILAKEIVKVPSDFNTLMKDDLPRRMFLAYVRGYTGSAGGLNDRESYLKTLLPLFPAEDKEIADQLAATAYEIGNYELAAKYAAQSQSAYSLWVQARLALQTKNIEKAATLYDAALAQQEIETDSPSLEPRKLHYEHAVLTLARGFYMKAFEEFAALGSSFDTDYLAIRILTIDEFKQFVDTNIPLSATIEPPRDPKLSSQENSKNWEHLWSAKQLRAILAHRLMRIGKHHEALPYFTDYELKYAKPYIDWLDKAAATTDNYEKANALYQAALIMREEGRLIMGDELARLKAPDEDTENDSFVTKGERERLAATRAETTLPPSYRTIGTHQLSQAADLLPPKSQAFAAILCRATQWMAPVSEEASLTYYQRYVKQGAIVEWATHFGHDCPAPDFAGAKYTMIKQVAKWLNHKIVRHWILFISGIYLFVILVTGALFYRLRKNSIKDAS